MVAKVMAVLAVCAVLAVSGCGGRDKAPGGQAPGGHAQIWQRTFLSTAVTENGQPRPLVAGTRIRLAFADGRVTAEAGCNHLGAPVRVAGDRLVVSDVGTTDMACGPERMAQDSWLTGFLAAGPAWRLDGDTLVLTASGTEIRLADQRVANPDRRLTGTRWLVRSIVDHSTASSVPAGVQPHLTLDGAGHVTGSTGCNAFGGPATISGNTVTFGPFTMTAQGCGPDAGRIQSAVLAVLSGPTTVQVEGDRLTVTRPDGHGLQLQAG